MKLPGIDYSRPVEDSSRAARATFDGLQRLAEVTSEGFQAYGQALVKSQQDDAKATLAEELNAAELALRSRKEWSLDEVKNFLGGDVPDSVKAFLPQSSTDQAMPIPSWAVSEAFFAKAAENAVRKASGKITFSPGWQADFQEQVRSSVEARKQGLALDALHGMHSFLQTSQRQTLDRLRNAGNFDQADAADMSALDMDERLIEVQKTEVTRQLRPAVDALTSENPVEVKKQLDRVRTDLTFQAMVPADTRKGLTLHLEERWGQYEGSRIATVALQAGNTPGSRGFNEMAALEQLDTELRGAEPGVEKAARAAFKARLHDFHEGRKNETAQVFAVALQAFNAQGPNRFSTAAVPPDVRAYLQSPANGKEAADLWNSLVKAEESRQLHNRSMAEKPTEEHYKAYAAVVKDMEDNPSKYRGMTAERFVAETFGKVGPLVDKLMAAYKGAVEAPAMDKRVLVAAERTALREALPPRYRPSNTTEPTSEAGKLWSQMEEKIAARKEREWADEKGPVPQGVIKEWVAEEWKKGTVKGGAWYQFDKTGVPKAVANVKWPSREFVPDDGTAPAAPAATDKVKVEYNGQRLFIPRSRLSEALKDGAKEIP